MAEEILLTAQPRTVIGKQVNALRRSGYIPAVIYGRNIAPLVIEVADKPLHQVLARAGHNRLIKLTVDSGEPHLVLTREIQVEPISRRLLHVDFQQVAMTEKLTTSVPLVLQGTSSVVSRGEGIIIHGLEEVTIRVLPADLIPEIEVDLSALTQLHQALHVSDLKVSPAIEILTNPDEMIAKTVPVKEEVIVEAAPVAAAEVEIIGKGKKEEAVSAEGAAAPAAGGEKKPEGKKEKPEAKKEEKK